MYIFSEEITPRLRYVVNVLFAGTEWVLTSSYADFYNYEGPKINYSKKKFTDKEFLIVPSGLLAESNIGRQNIYCSDWDGLKTFFQTNGEIPFDIFSACFYILSRYEEYLPHEKDSYGRFSHKESLAFKEGFLQVPLVDLWGQRLFNLLDGKSSGFRAPVSNFTFTPTYDIDIAYAYKGKGIVRKLMNRFKSEQTVLNGKDVFDVYDWLDELHDQYQLSPVYFFLLASQRGKYDKNLSPKSKELQQLIKNLSARYEIGIHPSWQSFDDETALHKEISSLSKFSQKEVNDSRQHYIHFTLPHTFQALINAGITNDYSMGYGSINGFRASTSSPFYWYDLMKEEATCLLLHPFCYMEANSFFEQQLSAEEAGKELQYYFEMVKQVNGNLITIFHNHFLTMQTQWQPWRKMYKAFLVRNFSKTEETKLRSL
jgi:hypothetical protein